MNVLSQKLKMGLQHTNTIKKKKILTHSPPKSVADLLIALNAILWHYIHNDNREKANNSGIFI